MTTRQRDWPRQWLMTDERLGQRLWDAIDRLPEQSGIVFRHYETPSRQRERLAAEVAAICRSRTLTLAIARDEDLAKTLGADLVHNPIKPTERPFSRAVHSLVEARTAQADGAALVFVSPVFPTSSHPGQDALGVDLAKRIAETAGAPAIALGGMDAQKFALLQSEGFYGWAGIDAWLGDVART